jgi:hypothetical protein
MRRTILAHLRGNIIGYVALFAALGGTSYAAVRLKPGSVTSAALATRAVTHDKLAPDSITSVNVARGALTAGDFKPGLLSHGTIRGPKGATGATGPAGPAGPTGAAGPAGGAVVGLRARFTGTLTAPKGASTNVPVSGNTWTQAANELNMITGSVTLQIPASCTGSFGNAVVASVDGTPASYAAAPTAPASGTVTMPFVVGTVMEAPQATPHTLTLAFGNSCTKDGESFTVSDVKIDVVRVP